ncbi:MAG: patatin-like phospholipase family protein [Acidobacteriota bacterium]|nr:patatin-like phospholipase family protein [Acidobacteriota bacterium]
MNFVRTFCLLVLLAAVAQAAPDASTVAASSPSAPRPRVALALSGGGPVGLAHIGVLEYFEEHHIPVDAIAGSSMGALIGGLYATGHSPREIERIMQQNEVLGALRLGTAYGDLPAAERNLRAEAPGDLALRLGGGLSLPAGLTAAEPADLLLSRLVLSYSGVDDFSQLPTAFRCVATRLQTGQPEVLKSGNLARALRASMSVPGLFSPVDWNGHALVDGGLVNNLPVDVARAMGAEVVIGVHFDLPIPQEKRLHSLDSVLMQSVSVAVAFNEREALHSADLILAPSLHGIGGIDVAHTHELIERGYQAAEQKARFLSTLALNDADWASYQAERRARLRPEAGAVAVRAQAADPALQRLAQSTLDHGDGSLEQIERALSHLAVERALPAVFYRLAPAPGAPQAIAAELDPRRGTQYVVRPALQMNIANGEPARGSVLAFATIFPGQNYHAKFRLRGAAGYSPNIHAEYESSFGSSRWFWAPGIDVARENSATYSGAGNVTHWQDRYTGTLAAGFATATHLRLRAGIAAGYVRPSAIAYPGALLTGEGSLVEPRAAAEWNSLNDPALPTRGVLGAASIRWRYRGYEARTVPLGEAKLAAHWPLVGGTFTTAFHGATSFGRTLNYFDLFPMGGGQELRAFRYEQFHAASLASGDISWRRALPVRGLFGERPQLAVWYDAAGLRQPSLSWQREQSGAAGLVLNSPLGVVTFAVGRTSEGDTRGWINVGLF